MMISKTKREFLLPDMDSTFRVFGAHWRTVESGWKYPSHNHPLFEVNLVLSGCQEMVVNRKTYIQKSGDLLLLVPGVEHESKAIGEEEMTYYCLHFDVDERAFRELLYRNSVCFHSATSELALAIRPALDKLITLTSEEAAARVESRMIILSALFELFAGISGTLSKLNQTTSAPRMSLIASQIAARLEEVVEAYEGDSTTDRMEHDHIASISAEIGYSTSSVNRMFTSVYGMSPRQYMSSLMLKKAKLMLMDPELTVEIISARLGYNNIAHFSRQFKRWTGESPTGFKNRFH
ncbi:Arabinose operon regulatory protein [compost metagenome]